MKIVKTRACNKVRQVKKIIKNVGNKLFAVTFIKRTNGEIRKMVCRKNVFTPQYAKSSNGKKSYNAKDYDLLTVFDVNSLKYNSKDKLCGRGNWKNIPLDGIIRIKVNGEIYRFID